MRKWVSANEKRSFLKWFLDNHRLKRIEARRLIEFLNNKTHILENLSFTEKINLKEKTIVISSTNSDETGFEYYYNQRKTFDVATAIGDITANPTSKINIILHFYGKMRNVRYNQLIEYTNDEIKPYELYQRQAKAADQVIAILMLEQEVNNIKKDIDMALDQKNEEQFHKLVEKLKELAKELQSAKGNSSI
ncbi:YpiB family protein [Bacillus sp. 03113]|uniref:YpiB family protein n=1 Tax=Bacillus sp. 03113 TaxID=2578211 RepID=UPI001143224F|nr:YpiB family protein [Bacillus sp. 03113]